VVVLHPQVGPAEHHAEHEYERHAGHRRGDQTTGQGGPTPTPPDDRGEHAAGGQGDEERQPEAEADRHLPGDHDPAGRDQRRPAGVAGAAPVAAQQQEERQRDAAAAEDVQVAALLQAPGRVGERCARHGRGQPPHPQLAGQQVGPGEGQRAGEEEDHVVADDRGGHAPAREVQRRVPDERVGEGERVGQRPELVGLEEGKGLVHDRVGAPGQLPRLRQRIAEVLGQVGVQVQGQRPEHRHGQGDRPDGQEEQLAPRQRGGGRQAPGAVGAVLGGAVDIGGGRGHRREGEASASTHLRT